MRVLLFILIAASAVAQPSPDNLVALFGHRTTAASCTPGTNTLVANVLTVRASTANVTFYETASFTPSSNALILIWEAFSPNGTDTKTNTGTTQLTWWPVMTTNYATAGTTHTMSLWASQLPQGTAPFSMTIVTLHGSGTGTDIIVAEVTGADQTAAFGTNAIVQSTVYAVPATFANPTNKFAAPGNNGLNMILLGVADDVNSATDNAPTQNWVEMYETNYNTPAAGLALYYSNNAPAALITGTNTATSRNWATIAVEVKAGTNCTVAGSGQSITDNFTRADGGDIGANWTPITSETGMQILSNQVQPQSVGSDCGEYYSGVSWSANQSAEVKVTVTGGTAGTGGGVVVRCASGARTYYRFVIDASGHWETGRTSAGSFTSLASGTTTYSAGAVLKLSIIGTTLVSTYNGVQLDSRTDSNIATGSPGLSYSSSTTTCILDDWTGIDGL